MRETSAGMKGRRVLRGVLATVILAVVVLALVLLFLDPLHARRFLIDARYAETILPIAHVAGFGGALLLTVMCWLGIAKTRRDVGSGKANESEIRPFKEVLSLIASPFLGYGIVYYGLKNTIPVVVHRYSDQQEFRAPFVVGHAIRRRGCYGVEAVHAEFYDDEICGVSREGGWAPYYGKEIVVNGKRSGYGFLVEGYRLPELIPNE